MADLVEVAARTVSLFDAVAYLWLGLTVLLNSERRVAGVWLGGTGLLIAGLFFAGHSALVGEGASALAEQISTGALEAWWRLAWTLFVIPTYLWCLVLAWYSGVWRCPGKADVAAAGVLGLLGLALLAAIPSLPDWVSVLAATEEPGAVPLLQLAYPAYGVACIALSLAALGRPSGTGRPLEDLGRVRADRWLRAATALLLAVGLLTGVAVASLVGLLPRPTATLAPPTFTLLLSLDALLAGLLGAVVVLLGRAVVSYEVFTGKALPRGDLYRHWRNSLLFAAGLAVVLGVALEVSAGQALPLALAAVAFATSLALQSWSTLVDRDRGVALLRPFVASQRLFEGLLEADAPEVDVDTPFRALVGDVLDAEVGYLFGLGPLAQLVGAPLAYPTGARPPAQLSHDLLGALSAPATLGVPLSPAQYGGAVWAVPLSGEGALVGVLLVGPKPRGEVFVQEELEIARAAGERLLDARAGAELARRLIAFQRERLATSLVLDQRTRRVLHDDVLPRLHAALLDLSAAGASPDAVASLAAVHRELSNLLRELPAGRSPDVDRLGLVGALRRTVEAEHSRQFEGVTWRVEPEAEAASVTLPGLAAEVGFGAAREAVRNAARHGRAGAADRPLHLSVEALWRDGLRVAVEDDGVGGAAARGVSAGGGQGLALHGTLLALVGGTLAIEDAPGGGTRVTISLPSRA